MSYRDPEFLRNHIKDIISFYHPTCIDDEFGGYINQFRDDGSVRGKTVRKPVAPVGRNEPCPCGSGRKFKKCCGRG